MDMLRKLQDEANKKAQRDGGLTDIQRDEVRALLGKYVRPAKRNSNKQLMPDPIRGVPPGSLIGIERCTGDAWQHRVIREARMCIYPYLLDNITVTLDELIVEVQQQMGGEVAMEGDTLVLKLEQGRPVAAIRIVVKENVVQSINFEVA